MILLVLEEWGMMSNVMSVLCSREEQLMKGVG